MFNRRVRITRLVRRTKWRPTTAVAALALVGCAVGQSSRYDTTRRLPSEPAAVLAQATIPTHAKGNLTARSAGTPGKYLLTLGDSLAAGYQPDDRSASPPVDPSTGFPRSGLSRGLRGRSCSRPSPASCRLGLPGRNDDVHGWHACESALRDGLLGAVRRVVTALCGTRVLGDAQG